MPVWLAVQHGENLSREFPAQDRAQSEPPSASLGEVAALRTMLSRLHADPSSYPTIASVCDALVQQPMRARLASTITMLRDRALLLGQRDRHSARALFADIMFVRVLHKAAHQMPSNGTEDANQLVAANDVLPSWADAGARTHGTILACVSYALARRGLAEPTGDVSADSPVELVNLVLGDLFPPTQTFEKPPLSGAIDAELCALGALSVLVYAHDRSSAPAGRLSTLRWQPADVEGRLATAVQRMLHRTLSPCPDNLADASDESMYLLWAWIKHSKVRGEHAPERRPRCVRANAWKPRRRSAGTCVLPRTATSRTRLRALTSVLLRGLRAPAACDDALRDLAGAAAR
jgi:hypothetical protein